MFAVVDEERSRTAEDARAGADCWRELGEIAQRRARDNQRETVLVRAAHDRGDWKRAGFSSPAAWLAQATRAEYRSAVRTTEVAEALRLLPALDEAFSSGAMTLDQAAAATPFATPETDARLARIAIDMPPSEIAVVARTLSPPTVVDDATLRQRRALSMSWIEGGRELAIKGRLPLEQGAAFEQAIRSAAKARRSLDKKHGGEALGWQQSTADALVALTTSTSTSDGSGGAGGGAGETGGEGSVIRSNVTMIVHLSPDEAPFIEGAGPISNETAELLTCDSRSLFIQPHGRDLLHSRVGRCASYAQLRALIKRSKHCQYPGCAANRELDAHHLLQVIHGGETLLKDLSLLCTHHHKLVHDHHIRTSGTGEHPVFRDETGRLITAARPHAPPG